MCSLARWGWHTFDMFVYYFYDSRHRICGGKKTTTKNTGISVHFQNSLTDVSYLCLGPRHLFPYRWCCRALEDAYVFPINFTPALSPHATTTPIFTLSFMVLFWVFISLSCHNPSHLREPIPHDVLSWVIRLRCKTSGYADTDLQVHLASSAIYLLP